MWYVGTGPGRETAARMLLPTALEAATSAGPDAGADPLRRITADAADLLGIGSRVGRLTRGRAADIVLWSGDPRDAASRVDRVYIGGRIVYRRPAAMPWTDDFGTSDRDAATDDDEGTDR